MSSFWMWFSRSTYFYFKSSFNSFLTILALSFASCSNFALESSCFCLSLFSSTSSGMLSWVTSRLTWSFLEDLAVSLAGSGCYSGSWCGAPSPSKSSAEICFLFLCEVVDFCRTSDSSCTAAASDNYSTKLAGIDGCVLTLLLYLLMISYSFFCTRLTKLSWCSLAFSFSLDVPSRSKAFSIKTAESLGTTYSTYYSPFSASLSISTSSLW